MFVGLGQRTRVRIPPVATCFSLLLVLASRVSTRDPRSSVKRDAFGTNTKYDSSFTWAERTERDKIPTSETCPHLRQCKPVHLSMLIRHGTRYPKKNDISKIDYVVSSIRHYGSKEKDIVNIMRRWQNSFEWQDTMMLAENGKWEMEELASRVVRRFPAVFLGAKPESLRFVSSMANRTIDSAAAFVRGIWNGLKEMKTGDSIDPRKLKMDAGPHTDRLLRFLEKCKKWSEEVEKNPEALQEVSKFLDGPELGSVLKNITSQLGPSVLLDFSSAHLKVMWTICAMETAVYGGRSIWCDLFTPEHLQVLEYLSDLKSYWKHGYGHRVNYRPACPILQGMLKPMEDFVSGNESSLRGQFLFGHADTLVPLYSLLGLFKDTAPLRADNFAEHANRVFRTSLISPFGANLALVLYKCDGASPCDQSGQARPTTQDAPQGSRPDDPAGSKFRVMMMVNERAEQFPGWHQVSCPYEVVRMLYKDTLERCEDTCNMLYVSSEKDHPEL